MDAIFFCEFKGPCEKKREVLQSEECTLAGEYLTFCGNRGIKEGVGFCEHVLPLQISNRRKCYKAYNVEAK